MGLKRIIKSIFGSNAAHSVETFALNEFDKAVAAAKQTTIGAAAAQAIDVVEKPGVSGPEKMVQAIAIVAPVVVSYIAKGGFSAVAADAETFARAVIESTLADTRQTKAAGIAEALLKLLGLL